VSVAILLTVAGLTILRLDRPAAEDA